MKTTSIVLLLTIVTFAGCVGNDAPTSTPTPSGDGDAWDLNDDVPEGSVHFIVLGDVGSGMDGEQDEVAAGVVKVCKARGCDFAIVAGDNIYNSGVRNEYDPQFNSKFEEPYKDVDMPFYLVLGNHDNGDGSGSNPAVGDYQVLYTHRKDRPSEKWNMPSRYYRFSVGNVTVVGLDSGPAEVATVPVWSPGSRGDLMQTWLAVETPKITTPWKFAFAHHMYWSNGPHGDAGQYDNAAGRGLFYKRMLEEQVCGKYDVYFSGHDHSLQWLQKASSCPKSELIISAAGGAELYNKRPAGTHPAYFEDYTHWGFWYVDVTGDTFTATVFDEHANALFERSFTRM
jgi:tartrate-resistant acid phosphatase type 5